MGFDAERERRGLDFFLVLEAARDRIAVYRIEEPAVL